MASALLGIIQFGIAASAATAVGAVHDGTARPMAAIIALCGLLGLLLHRGLVRPTPATDGL